MLIPNTFSILAPAACSTSGTFYRRSVGIALPGLWLETEQLSTHSVVMEASLGSFIGLALGIK